MPAGEGRGPSRGSRPRVPALRREVAGVAGERRRESVLCRRRRSASASTCSTLPISFSSAGYARRAPISSPSRGALEAVLSMSELLLPFSSFVLPTVQSWTHVVLQPRHLGVNLDELADRALAHAADQLVDQSGPSPSSRRRCRRSRRACSARRRSRGTSCRCRSGRRPASRPRSDPAWRDAALASRSSCRRAPSAALPGTP